MNEFVGYSVALVGFVFYNGAKLGYLDHATECCQYLSSSPKHPKVEDDEESKVSLIDKSVALVSVRSNSSEKLRS